MIFEQCKKSKAGRAVSSRGLRGESRTKKDIRRGRGQAGEVNADGDSLHGRVALFQRVWVGRWIGHAPFDPLDRAGQLRAVDLKKHKLGAVLEEKGGDFAWHVLVGKMNESVSQVQRGCGKMR